MRSADRLRRIGGAHRDDLGQREPEPEKARHHLRHAVHGAEPAGDREVRADAVREQTLVDDAAADLEAEVHPPVGGVEPDAPVGGLAGLGHQLAVGVEHAAGVGGEVVRQDVALVEERQERADHRRGVALLGVADVDHQLGAALPRRPLRQPGHLHAHDLERGRDHAGLDPADEALVLVGDLQRVVQVDAALRDDIGQGRKPRLADVQEGNHLGVAARDDVPGEAAEGGRPRAAGVDDGGDPGVHAAEIGVDAVPGEALEDVGVKVDQARGDDLPGHRDRPRRLGAGDVGGDARDHAVLHGDVEDPVEPRGRIHHGPTLEHEIMHGHSPRKLAMITIAAPARAHLLHALFVRAPAPARLARAPTSR